MANCQNVAEASLLALWRIMENQLIINFMERFGFKRDDVMVVTWQPKSHQFRNLNHLWLILKAGILLIMPA